MNSNFTFHYPTDTTDLICQAHREGDDIEMDQQKIFELLKIEHAKEDELNKRVGEIDKEVKELLKKKSKYARMISKNMRNRNHLISMIQR
jgi:hypothetical protein